jgi:hypothetical protein
VELVDSPRWATVLLVAGDLSQALDAPARRVHDQLPRPRATVWWQLRPGDRSPDEQLPVVVSVRTGDDLLATVRRVHADLLTGSQPSSPELLPDEDPNPWRGVGDYGQGGKGMTGGTPYGRPLAKKAPDRDGLQLDQLPLRFGPFFPPFPPGLVLRMLLQGDVVQEANVEPNPYEAAPEQPVSGDGHRPPGPASIAAIELVRARHHLRCLAEALRVHELDALALRSLRLARHLRPGDRTAVQRLGRTLRRTGTLAWATRGVGVVPADLVAGQGLGPVARAAGLSEDARSEDPAYQALGFEPVVHAAGDAEARWRQRLAEAEQALGLAERAGDATVGRSDPIESPRGRRSVGEPTPSARLLTLLPGVLSGLEWSDAVTTITSLDLDMEEAAVPAVDTGAVP